MKLEEGKEYNQNVLDEIVTETKAAGTGPAWVYIGSFVDLSWLPV